MVRCELHEKDGQLRANWGCSLQSPISITLHHLYVDVTVPSTAHFISSYGQRPPFQNDPRRGMQTLHIRPAVTSTCGLDLSIKHLLINSNRFMTALGHG